MIICYGSKGFQEPDVTPGKIQLITQKPAAGARREEMMIVMPFAGDIAWPQLVDREVFLVKVDTFSMFILSLSMSFVVECSHPNGPEAGGPEQGKDQRGPAYQIEDHGPEDPITYPSDQ